MSTSGGSYFKGWSSNLPYIPSSLGSTNSKETWIGHVLDVDYDTDPGKIRVRLVGVSKELNDDDVKIEAYPADMNMLKYPLPGESVLIVQGIRNQVFKTKFATAYYYISTISSNQNITFNSDPYMGQTVPEIKTDKVYTPEYEHRFENKFKSAESFILNNTTRKDKAPLRPYEGDFILQGRFGASIRLGSTGASNANPWSVKGGAPGNPIMIVSANRTSGTTPVTENVDESDSSVYLCSSQVIPVTMATSTELQTFKYKYNVTDMSTNADPTQFLESESHPPPDNYSNMGQLAQQEAADGNAPGSLLNILSGGGGGGNTPQSVTNTGGGLLGTSAAGQQIQGTKTSDKKSMTYKVVMSGNIPIIVDPVPSYGRRDEIRNITLHDTAGNDHAPLDTALGLPFRGSAIHWVVNGDGALARGDGGDELKKLVHGDDFNYWGMGIEVQTYGGLRYNATRKAFINGYDEVWPMKKSHNKFNKDIVDLGFTYNGSRYYVDYTDAQIASLTRIIQATFQKYPKIKQAIQGKPVYQTVFGLSEYPRYDASYTSINSPYTKNVVSEYGIFAHARSNGTHTDGTPTPRYVQMLMGFGFTGPILQAKGYWKTNGGTVIGLQ
jgi:hypothetical protein